MGIHSGDLDRIDQRGLDGARHHDRHPDAVPGQIEAQHLRKSPQPVLASAIGRMPRQANQPGRRGHIDQVPAPTGGDHRWDQGLDDVDWAHEIDRDHPAPLIVRELVNGAPGRHTGDV
ncbi:Uncharacterised protein [Mycobacterium tuberculosis]|nr:Uncharacterised protein [Mycobacterium tuberculosis]